LEGRFGSTADPALGQLLKYVKYCFVASQLTKFYATNAKTILLPQSASGSSPRTVAMQLIRLGGLLLAQCIHKKKSPNMLRMQCIP